MHKHLRFALHMRSKHYDYIFLGAGCASLSIIMRMIKSDHFNQKKILLVDKELKTKNDRTWCFWENTPGFFEEVVYHKWDELLFKSNDEILDLEMGNYQYKMIRGIDFYKRCFSKLNDCDNVDIIYGEISFWETPNNSIEIKIDNQFLLPAKQAIVFNSVNTASKREKGKFYLLQHFKGWIIETPGSFFNSHQATLMDFSVPQNHGTTFVYVLPLSERKALIEYTIFSKALLKEHEYDQELKSYLNTFLKLTNYTIDEEEFGVIPMTNANFPIFKQGMYFIGTAGGQTKPSTGYTFRFIQKQADEIVEELIFRGTPSKKRNMKKRFLFYDSTLLHILSDQLLEGKTIFSTLFKKNPASHIFKFLDNETSVKEEIILINSLPKKIFSKAGIIELIKMISWKRNT